MRCTYWAGSLLTSQFQEFNMFILQYFQLMITANKVRKTSQSLIILSEHVRTELDMLWLGPLSPSLVTPSHLRELLLRIQTEISHHLRFPVDPVKKLWRYYRGFTIVTIQESSKLSVLLYVLLLERVSTFEIYEVINLHNPYPRWNKDMK